MILIFYNRETKDCVKRFINPTNKTEYYSEIQREWNLLVGYELLDMSNFWLHITK
jgi:hypothetical protein